MVSEEERELIQERMAEAEIRNMGAYIRKMALNGYVLHVDLSPVRELVSLQRRCANNLNQVAIHANTCGVYPEEIKTLQKDYADMSRGGGFGEQPQQAFSRPRRGRKNSKRYTLALLAISAHP